MRPRSPPLPSSDTRRRGPVQIGSPPNEAGHRAAARRGARPLVLSGAHSVRDRHRCRLRRSAADRLRALRVRLGDHSRPLGRPPAGHAVGSRVRRRGGPLVAPGLHGRVRSSSLRGVRRHSAGGQLPRDPGSRPARRSRHRALHAGLARGASLGHHHQARPRRDRSVRSHRRHRLHPRTRGGGARSPGRQPSRGHPGERCDLRALGADPREAPVRRGHGERRSSGRRRSSAPARCPRGSEGPRRRAGRSRGHRRLVGRPLLRGPVQRRRAPVRQDGDRRGRCRLLAPGGLLWPRLRRGLALGVQGRRRPEAATALHPGDGARRVGRAGVRGRHEHRSGGARLRGGGGGQRHVSRPRTGIPPADRVRALSRSRVRRQGRARVVGVRRRLPGRRRPSVPHRSPRGLRDCRRRRPTRGGAHGDRAAPSSTKARRGASRLPTATRGSAGKLRATSKRPRAEAGA